MRCHLERRLVQIVNVRLAGISHIVCSNLFGGKRAICGDLILKLQIEWR